MACATPTSHQIKLHAPYLPQANKHGIGVSAAAHLRVTIKPYAAMDEGDLVELFWGGRYVASKLLTTADIGQTLDLRVPESFLQSGKVKTWYQIQKVGSAPSLSASVDVWVKLDCPGGHPNPLSPEENQSLAPLAVPDALRRQGLTAKQRRCGVELTIEAYQNMAAKDEITLRWGDVRMDLPAIGARDVGRPITLNVPPALILEGGEDHQLEVTYCIIDRVGNTSRWAPPRALNVSGVAD